MKTVKREKIARFFPDAIHANLLVHILFIYNSKKLNFKNILYPYFADILKSSNTTKRLHTFK